MSIAAVPGSWVKQQTGLFPSEETIDTHLRPSLAMIRAISILALTAFAAMLTVFAAIKLGVSLWVWPVIVIVGVAVAGKVLYTNFFTPDPLIEAFYKIVGGKEKFNRLPTIFLEGKTIAQATQEIKAPYDEGLFVYTALKAGRQIIFVQEKTKSSRENTYTITQQDGSRIPQKKRTVTKTSKTYAFIQNISPGDLPPDDIDAGRVERVHKAIRAIIFGKFDSDYFCSGSLSIDSFSIEELGATTDKTNYENEYHICSSLKRALVNRWHAQKDSIPLRPYDDID